MNIARTKLDERDNLWVEDEDGRLYVRYDTVWYHWSEGIPAEVVSPALECDLIRSLRLRAVSNLLSPFC
jgi:hypothetical protein